MTPNGPMATEQLRTSGRHARGAPASDIAAATLGPSAAAADQRLARVRGRS
jgi:hypothetical protein